MAETFLFFVPDSNNKDNKYYKDIVFEINAKGKNEESDQVSFEGVLRSAPFVVFIVPTSALVSFFEVFPNASNEIPNSIDERFLQYYGL